jgi:hypothetical protein
VQYELVASRALSSTGLQRAEQKDDVVLSAFKKQQAQYKELMTGLSKVDIPLDGDAAAIKGYAAEVEKLKKKVGMPDYEAVVKAEMAYAMSVAGNDVMDAIQEAEKVSGKELDASNEKGWKTLSSKIAAIEKKYGLQDAAKVREEAVLDMYMKHVQGVKDAVEGEIAKVKEAEGIDIGKVDLKGLKPQVS